MILGHMVAPVARAGQIDHRHHGQARHDQIFPPFDAVAVKGQFDRNALHDLREVAGGVVRRQQRIGRAGAVLDAVHPTGERMIFERIDGQLATLADAHVGQLRFLQVGQHPHIILGHRHERLASRKLLTGFHRLF